MSKFLSVTKLLGLEESECMKILDNSTTETFNNSVIVINNKKRMVMVCLVTDEIDDTPMEAELSKLDTILKAIYFRNFPQIETLVCVSIFGILLG